MKDFIEELKWRGMLHDVIPVTEEHLEKIKQLVILDLIQLLTLSILEV